MKIYVDVDGTLTKEQRANSVTKSDPWQEVIDKVRKLIDEGHEVVIWTRKASYAEKAMKHFGLDGAVACLGKPDLIIDNQKKRWGNRLKNRTVLPEDFLEMEIE